MYVSIWREKNVLFYDEMLLSLEVSNHFPVWVDQSILQQEHFPASSLFIVEVTPSNPVSDWKQANMEVLKCQ